MNWSSKLDHNPSSPIPFIEDNNVKPSVSGSVLEVEKLVTEFDTMDGVVHAVNGVSFEIQEGATLGVVGESGCGKSVSMLSVMRLLPQPPARIQADKIDYYDKSLLNLSDAAIRSVRGSEITMVFQDPMTSLNPVLSIGYQVMEPLRLHLGMNRKEAADRAGELLHLVGIAQPEQRLLDFPFQFSGGMLQRAGIAMALACNPSLLIADEPTTALDVTIQAQIVELVKRLRDQLGMALIWISHDLGVVAGLVDRVNVMYAGYIVEKASTDDLYANPRHPYTALLLRSLPRLDSVTDTKLQTVPGQPCDLVNLPSGCPFAARCPFAQDICLEEMPPLEEVGSGHQVACWVDIDTGTLR